MEVWLPRIFILGKKIFCTIQTQLEHNMREMRFALPWKWQLWIMIPCNLVHGSQGLHRKWRERVPPKRQYSSATPYGFITRKFSIWIWTSTVKTIITEMWSVWSGIGFCLLHAHLPVNCHHFPRGMGMMLLISSKVTKNMATVYQVWNKMIQQN